MLLVYLGLTVLIELPIFLLFWYKEGIAAAVVFCCLVNGFTNPLLNWVLVEWGGNVGLLEAGVLLMEMAAAMLVFRARWEKSLLFSFSANACSYSAGVLLFHLGWL